MNTPRHRIDRETAERLLDGDPRAYRDDAELLAALLTAVAAPATPRELAGEDAAISAFRAGRHPATAGSRRGRAGGSSRLFTIKAAVLAIATATAAGGVALAASSGALPHSLGGTPSTSARAPQPGARSQPGRPGLDRATAPTPTGAATTGATAAPQLTPSGPPGSAAPTPSLVGLCRAYEAKDGNHKGDPLDNAAFATLITKAGGVEKVDAFCRRLLADSSAGGPKGKPKGKHDDEESSAGTPTDEATAGENQQEPLPGSFDG